ncbi:hypothetical protein RP20_CCG013275 [Aedes albopictus]|nr:hypothetical protein RP20_CCG013275 [Aedes albopictus]
MKPKSVQCEKIPVENQRESGVSTGGLKIDYLLDLLEGKQNERIGQPEARQTCEKFNQEQTPSPIQ